MRRIGSATTCAISIRSFQLALLATLLVLGAVSFGLRQRTALAHPAKERDHAGSATQINPTPVTTLSAASFELASLAPGAIASSFGTQLATRTEIANSQPLPTNLAGTTVRVRDSANVERTAALFFVSVNQINFVVPADTAVGTATLTVQSGDGTTSQGTLEIKAVAPAIFTANSDGRGAPAAVLLRVRANGQQVFEDVYELDAASGTRKPKAIDLTPAGDQVFLVAFLTGIRRAPDPNNDGNKQESVHLLLGGTELTPLFVGAQGSFAGLDQMNVELPRALIGRGRISLSIIGPGASSNLTEVEFGAATGTAPPAVTSFSETRALAGQQLVIGGNGFSANPADNLVRIGGVEALVAAASPTQLTVVVPFGAETGAVSVRTNQGEGRSGNTLQMRTSLSGFVETTTRQPLSGAAVKFTSGGRTVMAQTGSNGSFVLPDLPGGLGTLEVDGTNLAVNPPFTVVRQFAGISANRDNPVSRPIALQQVSGSTTASGQVGGGGFAANVSSSEENLISLNVPAYAPDETAQTPGLQTGNVTLQVPANAPALFPNGATSGVITLTQVENSRTPTALPTGVFSSTIVQITPFNVQLKQGAKFTFPNADGFPAGAQVKLYRLDQTEGSGTLGQFIEAGTATVSNDGQRIETASNAVALTSYYFVANPRPTTTVTGRVFDNDRTPVRFATVRTRGQEGFTDGSGGFILRNVPVETGGTSLIVEASLARPNGRVDRAQSANVRAVPGGITEVGEIILPAANSNQPPVVLISSELSVNAGQTRDIAFVASDPDGTQPVQLVLAGLSFASVVQTPALAIRLAPTLNDVGTYVLALTARDSQGGVTIITIRVTVLRSNRTPTANSQVATLDEDTTRNITLAGSDPDGDSLIFIIVSNPARGTLSGSGANRVYTPNKDYSGADSFQFKVNDGLVDSNIATVAITVNPVNDPPVLTVPGPQTVVAGQRLVFNTSATDPDVGQTITLSASNVPSGATFNSANGQFIWTPTTSQVGTYPVTFTATDNGTPPLSDVKQVSITVTGQAFAVRDHRISAGPFDNACTPPPIKTTFLPTDQAVFQWTLVAGAKASDVMHWDFIQPNGSVYTSSVPSPLGIEGNVCNRISISIAGTQAAALIGNWQVRVFYNGALIVTDNFTITTASGINVTDSRTSAGPIPEDCDPPATKTAFLTTDLRAYQWTHISNGTQGAMVRWDFIQPNGSVFFTTNTTLNFTGAGCFWAWINIAESNAAGLPGTWQARVFYNGAQIATNTFTITSASGVNLLDHRITSGPIPADCVAPASKMSYLTTDPLMYQWTNVSGAKAGDAIRWDFIQPNGSVYLTSNFNLNSTGSVCFWAGINIAGQQAASLPGAWQVRVYYKGALLVTDNFTISRAGAVAPSPVVASPVVGGVGQSRGRN
jgi:uncharacterized protein (TIGR03437 family)